VHPRFVHPRFVLHTSNENLCENNSNKRL
jgi:hypothetical protein